MNEPAAPPPTSPGPPSPNRLLRRLGAAGLAIGLFVAGRATADLTIMSTDSERSAPATSAAAPLPQAPASDDDDSEVADGSDGFEQSPSGAPLAFAEGGDVWNQRPGFAADESDPEPISSTGSNKLDLLRVDDPTTFTELTYLGQGPEEILAPDKGGYEQVDDAHLFRADFNDGTAIDIRVHPEVGDVDAVTAEVERYTVALGQLPTVLRASIARFAIRSGSETATGSYLEGISVQTANMGIRIADNRLEETLFHESVHTSLDHKYSYMRSQAWLDAQFADGRFLAEYGRNNPDSEDLAETALYAYVLLNHPDRVPDDLAEAIRTRVPHRLAVIEQIFS